VKRPRTLVKYLACHFMALGAFAAAASEIHGQVVDSQTGEAIARARVTLEVADNVLLVALTNPDGTFQVRNLPKGSCRIWGDRHGYLGGAGRIESTSTVSLLDAKEPIRVLLRLTRQSVIEGRILDESGESMAGMVRLLRQMPGRLDDVRTVHVDASGDFRMAGLEAGRYYLAASVPQYGHQSPQAYPSVYYPRARDFQSAKPIDVEAGQREHVEIRMAAVAGYEVRGRIVPGAQSAGVTLQLLGEPQIATDGNFTAWDPPSQTFKISGVPPGTYILTVFVNLDGKECRASQTIKVSDSDIDGIRLEPVPVKPNPVGR
jgi:hypothetical protein